MRFKVWKAVLPALFILAAITVLSAGVITEESTGKTFPPSQEISAGGQTYSLECAGVGVRKKVIVKVYALGYFVESPFRQKMKAKWQGIAGSIDKLAENEGFFQELTRSTYCRRFEMKFVRDVGAEKIRDAFREGIEANVGGQKKPDFQTTLTQFLAWFKNEFKDGDVVALNILPDGTVEAYQNDAKLGSLRNADLATGVTSIWLGKECISDSLKKDLIRLFYK